MTAASVLLLAAAVAAPPAAAGRADGERWPGPADRVGSNAASAPAGVGALKPLLDLIQTVKDHYAGDGALSDEILMKEAAEGMVASLDRYSEFLDQQKYKDLQEDTRGSFGGIGIEIGIVNGKLSVIAPIEGTPADRAGLQGGDVIAMIDGTATDDMKIMDAVHRIKGPEGTTVTLTVQREGQSARTVALTRAIITPVNIRDHVLEEAQMGYVAIRSFSEHTADRLHEALRRFGEAKLAGIILDLRSNPGGLLQEAYRVADLFLPDGLTIVSTEGRDPQQRAKYFSSMKPDRCTLPLVVLTNEHSASGSEIVAGALKDHGRGVVMGRRTFGKASVQSITPVSRDRALAVRLTVAHYYTPNHDDIHEIGIEPDVNLPPVRLPAGLRKLQEETAFNRFAAEVLPAAAVPSGTGWLDPEAFKAGRLAPARKGGEAAKLDERIASEFRRWTDRQGFGVPEDQWDDVREAAVEQVRIAAMRRVKGEEAARRFAVEFDPQVRAAASLLKLAVPAAAP